MKNTFVLALFCLTASISHADIFPHILIKYPNTAFVCTGIASGEIFARAIEVNVESGFFSEIYGVEKDEILVDHSQKHVIPKYLNDYKPKGPITLKVFNQDSTFDLANVIKTIDKPITFVLASQFPDWTTPEKPNLILEELDQIKQHHIHEHTILIDYIGFGNVSVESLKSKLLEINPDYRFKLEMGGHIGKQKDTTLVAYLP